MGSRQYTLSKEDVKTIMNILDKNNIYYSDGVRDVDDEGNETPFHTTYTKIVICSVEDEHEDYRPYVQVDSNP